jgi:predicted SpoU family rRNA methylase
MFSVQTSASVKEQNFTKTDYFLSLSNKFHVKVQILTFLIDRLTGIYNDLNVDYTSLNIRKVFDCRS